MAKPLLLVQIPSLKTVVKKVVKVSKKSSKTKKKTKKPELPTRPSPFKIGDEVWYRLAGELKEGVINKCIPPRKTYGEIGWSYSFGSAPNAVIEEGDLFPSKI